jgi:hypothetical protein
MEYIQSMQECFYEITIPRLGNDAIEDWTLIALTFYQRELCGLSLKPELNATPGNLRFIITVQGNDSTTPGTENYPYYFPIDSPQFYDLPYDIQLQIIASTRPIFLLQNKRKLKDIRPLYGGVPSWQDKTYHENIILKFLADPSPALSNMITEICHEITNMNCANLDEKTCQINIASLSRIEILKLYDAMFSNIKPERPTRPENTVTPYPNLTFGLTEDGKK